MKKVIQKISFTILAAALMAPACLLAQKNNKDKEVKEEKEVKEQKKETEQIIITRKGNIDEKIVVEVIGDKVIVNGKEVKDDKDGEVTVRRHQVRSYRGNTSLQTWNDGYFDQFSDYNDQLRTFTMDENRAMLGVNTDQGDNGAEIQSITKESAAEKAGLKKGDIITKVGDQKIETPDDLTKAIHDHKPGDKVSITYLREKKEQKVTAELGKWESIILYGNTNTLVTIPRVPPVPRVPSVSRLTDRSFGQTWNWSGTGPKLGISVQDAEDGKGVNVIEVDEDGNAAKAGIEEDDIITEVDGKAVNSTDEIAKLIKESKDKVSVKIKLLRNGKTENIEVKIPRKLKTAEL